MACKLSVNVNAVAFLRNRRPVPWPSLEGIGRIALEAGAVGLTVHPRPDERHVRHADVPVLRNLIRNEFPGREYNIEGFPDERFLRLVGDARPDQVTLVPDDPSQGTSDHGWDIAGNRALLGEVIKRLQGQGMRVSLFIDPDPVQIEAAARTGAEIVELHTGAFANAHGAARTAETQKLIGISLEGSVG